MCINLFTFKCANLYYNNGLYSFLGGSLTVQILGSSPSKSRKDESLDNKLDPAKLSDKQKGLSASQVVSSRKDISDLLK